MTTTRSTILQFSDIHFGSQHGFETSSKDAYTSGVGSLLDYVIADLEKTRCQPDLLILSGDLTSQASKKEFSLAREFCNALTTKCSLDTSRLIIVPGNHDAVWLPSGDEATLSEYSSFASSLYQTPVDNFEIRFAVHGEVFVLGLDATRLEKPKVGGMGFIGRDQLRKAEEILTNEASAQSVRILVVHHHLLPVAWVGDNPANYPPSVTIDAPLILKWAQEHRFSLVLHGHQHQQFLSTFHFPTSTNGPFIVSGAPSIGAKREALPHNGRNGYQIITVDGNELEIETRLLNEAYEFDSHSRVAFIRDTQGRVFAKSAFPGTRDFIEISLVEAREQCLTAAVQIRKAVGDCYGPHGGLRGVRGTTDHVRDGQLVIESIEFATPVQQRFSNCLRSLTKSIATLVGDGRKTALLMCLEMVEKGFRSIADGTDDIQFANDLVITAKRAHNVIRERLAKTVDSKSEIARVIETSTCGNQEIAKLLTDAMEAVGRDGVVVIQHGQLSSSSKFELKVERRAYFHAQVSDWHPDVASIVNTISDCAVLIIERKFGKDILVPILEFAVQDGRPLLLVSEEMDEVAQEILRTNIHRGLVRVLSVSVKAYGSRRRGELTDLATLSGAHLFDATSSFVPRAIRPEIFGTLTKAEFEDGHLFVTSEETEARAELAKRIRSELNAPQSPYDQEQLQGRLARVSGAIATLSALGTSETEQKILRNLAYDGFLAASRAVEGGVIAGGGAGLTNCRQMIEAEASELDRKSQGFGAVMSALDVPYTMLGNAGMQDSLDAATISADVIVFAAEVASRIIKTRSWEPGESIETLPEESRAVMSYDQEQEP